MSVLGLDRQRRTIGREPVGLVFSAEDTAKLREILAEQAAEESEADRKAPIRRLMPWLCIAVLILAMAIAAAVFAPQIWPALG